MCRRSGAGARSAPVTERVLAMLELVGLLAVEFVLVGVFFQGWVPS